MKKITVTETFKTVNSGQVELTSAQAEARKHALEPTFKIKATKQPDVLPAGVYRVTAPIQFKKGEIFGYDGEVGKNGVLSDPEAEEIERLEALDRARAEGLAAGREQGRAEVQDELEKLKTSLQEEVDKVFAAGKEAGLKEAADKASAAAPAAPSAPSTGGTIAPDLLGPGQ